MQDSNPKRTLPLSISKIGVFTIPTPASEDHISLYTEIRLSTLFVNPEAFGSTYGGESAFTREQWRSRLNTPGRHTLIASGSVNPTSPTVLVPPPRSDLPLETTWMGTLGVLAPHMLVGGPEDVPYPPEVAHAEMKGEAEVWMLVGMWVRPGARGQGIGKLLVEHALEVIKRASPGVYQEKQAGKNMAELLDVWGNAGDEVADRDSRNADSRVAKEKDRFAMLRVYDHNTAAIKLYESAGFIKVPRKEIELAGELENLLGLGSGKTKAASSNGVWYIPLYHMHPNLQGDVIVKVPAKNAMSGWRGIPSITNGPVYLWKS